MKRSKSIIEKYGLQFLLILAWPLFLHVVIVLSGDGICNVYRVKDISLFGYFVWFTITLPSIIVYIITVVKLKKVKKRIVILSMCVCAFVPVLLLFAAWHIEGHVPLAVIGETNGNTFGQFVLLLRFNLYTHVPVCLAFCIRGGT